MLKLDRILYALLFASLIVATNLVVTNHMVDKAISGIKMPTVPKIVVVDLDKIVQSKMDEGMTPLQIVTFSDTLTQLLIADGYVIVDSKAVINSAPQYVLNNVSTEQLAEMVKQKGIKIRDNKTLSQALASAQDEFDKLVKPE